MLPIVSEVMDRDQLFPLPFLVIEGSVKLILVRLLLRGPRVSMIVFVARPARDKGSVICKWYFLGIQAAISPLLKA